MKATPLFVFFLAALGAGAQPAVSPLPPAREERLGVFPPLKDLVQTDRDRSYYLSRDGQHVAVVVKAGNQFIVSVDGQAGPAYDGIRGVTLSPSGGHFAYRARSGLEWSWVLDGKKGEPGADLDPPSPAGPPAPMLFSDDRKHSAGFGRTGAKSWVILDGHAGPEFDAVSELSLSADGHHMAYLASDHQKHFVVFDGQPGPDYDFIAERPRRTAPVLSPDGRRFAYEARIGVPGWDGHGRPVRNDTVSAKPFIVVDGLPGPRYDTVDRLLFSADSGHVAYLAGKDGRQRVVLDGRESAEYRGISGLTFSPEGTHLAYVAWEDRDPTGHDRVAVVLDGREGPPYETVIEDWDGSGNASGFTPEGTLAYLAVRAGVLYRVTQPLAK